MRRRGEGRRIPRDLMERPKLFGQRRDAAWKRPPNDDPISRHQLAAAYFQHRVAFAVNEALDLDPQLSLEVLADRVGLTPETLGRKLRGWSAADLDEILGWADEVGVDVLPVIQSGADLYPSA